MGFVSFPSITLVVEGTPNRSSDDMNDIVDDHLLYLIVNVAVETVLVENE